MNITVLWFMAFCSLVSLVPAVLPSRWRLEVSPKCWYLHGIPSEIIVFFVLIILRIPGATFAVNYTTFDVETKCKVLLKITYSVVHWKNRSEGWILLCSLSLNTFSSYETSHDIKLGTTAVCGNFLFCLLALLTAFVCSIVLVCVRTGCPGLSSTGYLCCSWPSSARSCCSHYKCSSTPTSCSSSS